MKVMGHRGAAGLALENTLDGFKLAKILGVDSIELDIHITKDNHLVVVHDSNLSRVSNNSRIVRQSTLKEIQSITLFDEISYVPTLEEVLVVTKKIPLFIEIKAEGCIDELIKIIGKHKMRDLTIVSFKHNELQKLRSLKPDLMLYANERTKPFEIIQFARSLKLNGIGLNYWLLNPLTYWMAKRSKLDIFVYTVNSKFIGNIIRLLYPKVMICSDYPERFLKHHSLLDK